MVNNIKTNLQKLKQFDQDRIVWLKLSGLAFLAVIIIIIDWLFFGVNKIYWVLVSLGLLLSMGWWYWTMKLIRDLLKHRIAELEILSDIVSEIKEIRKDVKNIDQRS